MLKFRLLLTSCTFVLLGLSSASAAVAYVDAKTGADSGSCPLASPCATLNYALQQIADGDQIVFLSPGVFGPIRLTGKVSIIGVNLAADVQIVANPAASPGCIGAAPGNCGANSGYGVEVAAGSSDTVKISHVLMSAGSSGNGALLFSSGGKISLTHSVFRGNSTAATPIVALYPNNGAAGQAQVYFSGNDVGFHSNGGAVEVIPAGLTSLKLHFNHVEVHNANFGIRTDGSNLTNSSAVVATFISESEFFSFNVAAVNAFSTSGHGLVNAVFDTTRILNAQVALKGNGPLTSVILTNNTVSGNGIGIQAVNNAAMISSGNNTVFGNTTNVNLTTGGTLTTQPTQ